MTVKELESRHTKLLEEHIKLAVEHKKTLEELRQVLEHSLLLKEALDLTTKKCALLEELISIYE